MNIKIDTALLDSLTEQAKASPRLRMNFDLRTSDADTSPEGNSAEDIANLLSCQCVIGKNNLSGRFEFILI